MNALEACDQQELARHVHSSVESLDTDSLQSLDEVIIIDIFQRWSTVGPLRDLMGLPHMLCIKRKKLLSKEQNISLMENLAIFLKEPTDSLEMTFARFNNKALAKAIHNKRNRVRDICNAKLKSFIQEEISHRISSSSSPPPAPDSQPMYQSSLTSSPS